tara:strand:+ start:854 stop:1120 length:267 start_codon:yes stop_codon:yes gene_type:complete
MIEWIVDVTTDRLAQQRKRNKKKANQYERLHHRIDDVIRYCNNCNRIWQKNRKMMTRRWEYYPKGHIPTLGKKREHCPDCKDANNDSI